MPNPPRMIRRSDMWRQNYLARRYLEGASPEEIAARLRWLVENQTTLTPEGKIGFLAPANGGAYWLELVTHVLTEYSLRGIARPPDQFLAGASVPRPTYPSIPNMVAALSKIELPLPNTFLVKLGRREHMEALYSDGTMRVSPASFYSDPSLNAAIQDDELSLSVIRPRREVRVEVLDRHTGKGRRVQPISDLTFTRRLARNYYVYCTATTLDLRLFGDFDATACVIITDPSEFRRRAQLEMQRHLSGWKFVDRAVTYIDPYNCNTAAPSVMFGKHFKFSYQHEHRAVWAPPTDFQGEFAPIYLCLGSLADIAELIVV